MNHSADTIQTIFITAITYIELYAPICKVQYEIYRFLPRDATQNAVLLWHVLCLFVRPSVCNVDVPWSHELKFLENSFTAE